MYDKELAIAVKAAKAAGNFLSKREDMVVDGAEGKDIKLSADRLSERIILDCLGKSGLPVLSEEAGYIGEAQEYLWVVDPLDGTMNYLKGIDDFVCVSIALCKNGRPILGVINRFFRGELYCGVIGEGAFLNGERICPSVTGNMEQAVLATGFPVAGDYSDDGLLSLIKQIQSFKKIRMLGSAALMGVFVASGKIDVYHERGIMLWDVAAAAAIVDAAGGCAVLEPLGDNKCVCKCFANTTLMDNYGVQEL